MRPELWVERGVFVGEWRVEAESGRLSAVWFVRPAVLAVMAIGCNGCGLDRLARPDLPVLNASSNIQPVG